LCFSPELRESAPWYSHICVGVGGAAEAQTGTKTASNPAFAMNRRSEDAP
jgi:hypothetical protein